MMQNEKRSVFILSAGLGTRLKELTSDKPKALIKFNNQTLLEIIIEKLISQRFNHFVINIHHFGEQIIDFLNNKDYPNVEIEISDERDFLYDTGGGILKALPLLSKSKAVLIHNVDIITDVDFISIYDDFIKSDDAAWLLTQNRDNKRKLVFDNHDNFLGRYNQATNEYDGDIDLQDNFKLLSFSGLHLIKPECFSSFELRKCYIFDLYREISKQQHIKSKFIEPDYWFDLGTKEQLKEASEWLLSQK